MRSQHSEKADVEGCSVLSVSPELLGVSVLPVGADGGSLLDGLVSLLVHASSLLAGGGEAAHLAVLHLSRADPVDAWVAADGLVGWVNEDDFKELEASVLTNPVGVEHAHVRALAADSLLSDGLEGTGSLQLADTEVSGLTADSTLGHVSLTATSSDADAVDNVALLGLVSETACLIRAGGARASGDNVHLTVLPGANTHDESADVTLLLSPKLLKVLVGSHS